jgi:hypothetical protein
VVAGGLGVTGAIPPAVVEQLSEAEAGLGPLATASERREAICQAAERCRLDGPTIWGYLDGKGLLAALPWAALSLIELARERGWRVHQQTEVDTGGSPYLALQLVRGTLAGGDVQEFRLTWHTRGHGTFRLFSMLGRAMDGRGWTEPRSLAAVRGVVAGTTRKSKREARRVIEGWTEVRSREDADAIRELIESVHDGHYATGPIDWEDFIDRLDGERRDDGVRLDMGDQLDSPAIRRVKAIVAELRAQAGEVASGG